MCHFKLISSGGGGGGTCPMEKNKIEGEVMITLPSVPNDEIVE